MTPTDPSGISPEVLAEDAVVLYQTNADNVVIRCGSSVWHLGPVTPDMAGRFQEDARALLAGDWDPSETFFDHGLEYLTRLAADRMSESEYLEGLRAVAAVADGRFEEIEPGTEVAQWLVDPHYVKGGARLYVGDNIAAWTPPPPTGRGLMLAIATGLDARGLPVTPQDVDDEAAPHLIVQTAVDRWVNVARDPYDRVRISETPTPTSHLVGEMYAFGLSGVDAVVDAVLRLVDGEPVVWAALTGPSPESRAVEPGAASIDIPDDVLKWAADLGTTPDDPDKYLLVTTPEHADTIDNDTAAFRRGMLPADDVSRIRVAVAEAHITTAAEWANALDDAMERSGQDVGTFISHGYANGELCGVELDPGHEAADNERAVIVSTSGWVVRYYPESKFWVAV